MASDEEVRAAYDMVRDELVQALDDGPFVAEWIEDKGAIYAYIETPLGRVMTYLPAVVFGGLMSDRQLADAHAHAETLASRLSARTPQPDTGET